MRERVLAIVSIIAQYVMEEGEQLSETDIIEELMAEGYEADEIDAAFRWMEDLSLSPREHSSFSLSVPSHRVFTPEEARAITPEARGFLVRLRTLGIIEDDSQEEIIDKALNAAEDAITLKEIKAIAAFVLFSRSNQDWRREVDCFLDDDWARIFH